jgi:hypothetical protein
LFTLARFAGEGRVRALCPPSAISKECFMTLRTPTEDENGGGLE